MPLSHQQILSPHHLGEVGSERGEQVEVEAEGGGEVEEEGHKKTWTLRASRGSRLCRSTGPSAQGWTPPEGHDQIPWPDV